MKLQLYRYTCRDCQKYFKVPELPVDPYGEFLLTSETGDVAYLNADVKEFSEISELVDQNKRVKKMDEDKRADIFHEIYVYICDLALDGSRYDMLRLPLCPYCHSNKNLSWMPTYPAEYVYEEVKALPHHRWNQLTEDEKKELIDNEIRLALEGKFSNYLKSK
jgi:hypothetical protein